MIISVEGMEASGKSTFMYTAPLPIVGFSLDMGHERAIYGMKFGEFFKGLKVEVVKYAPKQPEYVSYKGNDITIYELPPPIQLDPKRIVGYMELWDYFLRIYVDALQDSDVSTVVIDTMTLLTKNKRDAYLQELQAKNPGNPRKQLQQIEYGHPDGGIRSLYTFAKTAEKNLVAIHHLRDHYGPSLGADGQVTTAPDGTMEIDGLKDTPRFVDVRLLNEKKNGQISSTFVKCGYNLGLEGTTVNNLSWDMLVNMIEMTWSGRPFDRRAK